MAPFLQAVDGTHTFLVVQSRRINIITLLPEVQITQEPIRREVAVPIITGKLKSTRRVRGNKVRCRAQIELRRINLGELSRRVVLTTVLVVAVIVDKVLRS